MISKECFTLDWINELSAKFKYNDRILIEKVIRAFSLLELLVSNGCPLTWKGGTSLMLILGSSSHRLSIDIDVICPPGTDITKYMGDCEKFGFTNVKMIERVQLNNVPKTHSKFYYEITYKYGNAPEEFILLDVLYEDCLYDSTNLLDIACPFIKLDGDPLKVRVPSVNDILGDKLTAYAPNTSGIPYIKNGRNKSLDIIKQLFDISRLMDNATDFSIVANVFRRIGATELKYRNIDPDVNLILNDIRETSLCLSTYGKEGNGNYEALVDGVSRIHSFTYMERYPLEAAIVDASKAAFLATMIEKGFYDYRKYDPALPGLADMRLDDTVPVRLNRLRRNIPEAYYYWVLTSGLLK